MSLSVGLKALRLSRRVTVLKLAENQQSFTATNLEALAEQAVGGKLVESESRVIDTKTSCAYAVGQIEALPSFSADPKLRERRFSLAFLLSPEDLLVVFLAGGASLLERHVKGRYVRLESEQVGRLLDASSHEKVRALALTNMSIARHAVHQRLYRGEDIEWSVPSASQNRHIPGRVETSLSSSRRRTANLATGHVAESGGRVDVAEFVKWASVTVDRLRDTSAVPMALLGRYAHSVRFSELAQQGVTPNGALFDLAWLREQVDDEGWTARRPQPDGTDITLTTRELGSLLEKLSHSCELKAHPKKQNCFQLTFEPSVGLHPAEVPELRLNKQSISLTGDADRMRFVTSTGDTSSLGEQVRSRPSLFVTMSSPEYAYSHGRLFADRRFKAMVPQLRSLLFPVPSLAACKSEKGAKAGALVGGQRTFQSGTLFRVIEDDVANAKSLLVCNDMGDEWADFIEVRTDPAQPIVAFYHAKHKAKDSLGASTLHDVVGQALKNLGRVNLTRQDLETKRASWKKKWRNGPVSLLRRGTSADVFCDELLLASSHSQAIKRVCLVASVLSLTALDDLLNRASAGQTIQAHEVQLIHILMSFSSACAEVSAQARVYVKP